MQLVHEEWSQQDIPAEPWVDHELHMPMSVDETMKDNNVFER
jgi:hypothetical protein